MISNKLLFILWSDGMENKQKANSNDRKQQNTRKGSSSNNSNSNNQEAKDGINYDFDWNTDYGDGDIPDIDEP